MAYKLQYTVFCLLTVYFIISRIHRSNYSISQARVICQVRLLDYKMLNARNVLVECLTDTSRHPDRCEEHVRAGNLTYEVEK